MATETITQDMTIQSEARNIVSAMVNAGINASNAHTGAEITNSNISITYATITNTESEIGNSVITDDAQALENDDPDDTGQISYDNAECNKDNNKLQQELSKMTTASSRNNDSVQADAQASSDIFSEVQFVLSTYSSMMNSLL
jgi:hypothetical protein